MKGLSLNKNLIIEAGIAALVVENFESILGKIGVNLTSPYTKTLAGAAAAFGVGMLMKKPNIQNIGIAIAASKILSTEIIQPTLKDYANSFVNPRPLMLADYTSVPSVNRNYAQIYE